MATKAERRAAFQASAQGQLQDKKPELSKAERRAKQEAQRAAKAAAASASQPSAQNKSSSSSGGGGASGSHKKAASSSHPPNATNPQQQQQQQPTASGSTQNRPNKNPAGSNAAQPSAQSPAAPSTLAPSIPTPSQSLLSHLACPPLHVKTKNDNLVHPSIARLALSWSTLALVGTNARAISMLCAFQDMLRSYSCPEGTTLARHFPTTYLSPQIECLYRARMRSLSLGNAIRWFKAQVAECRELSEPDAKDYLISAIDSFIRERIILADQIIVKLALDKIRDGQVVLTYGRSVLSLKQRCKPI